LDIVFINVSLFFLLTLLIFFTGCSSKNAFSQFKMSKEQELSASSLQSSKIISKTGEVDGIFSAIYLNEVYPELFSGDEYFFVYMFMKDSKELYDPNNPTDTDLKLKVNSKLPIKIEKLPKENQFSDLVSVKSSWNRYYLVVFKQEDTINLVLENGQSSSTVFTHNKDES